MSKDRILPLAFQETSFCKRKDIFFQHCGREQGEFQTCQHLMLGQLRGPAQDSAVQKSRSGQKGRSVPEQGVIPVFSEHMLPLCSSELTCSIWRVWTVKTISQCEYCHYLTVFLCWLLVHAHDSLSWEFIRTLFHSNLHPTGTGMVNA